MDAWAGSTRSALFKTNMRGTRSRLNSLRIPSTTSTCRSNVGLLTSATCRSRSASCSSSSVARNAPISSSGRFRMKPTVSVTIASRSSGNRKRRLAVSSVSKRRFWAVTRLQVRTFSKVDLPAFVYPTIEMMGTSRRSRRARCWARFLASASICFSRCVIRSRTRRRSTSSFVSPGPRPPIPPASLDIAVPCPVRRGRR